MAVYCQHSFKCKCIRLTKLDSCGAPVHGAKSTLVSKGLVVVTLTPTYESGTDYLLRNGNDELEINEQGLPLLRWWQAQIDFISVDPDAVSIVLGYPQVLDDNATPNTTGWRSAEGVSSNFALEAWQQLSGDACSTAAPPVGYRLLPWLLNPQVTGDIKIGNEVATFSVMAHTHNGATWGTGPYNVRYNNLSVASPLLTAIQPLEHLHYERVTLAPPTPACGAVLLP
jgi:hypothetical protein